MILDPESVERGRWIYSAWKHIRHFAGYEASAVFEATSLAGRACDLLGRMRELHAYPLLAVEALAKDCGITRVELGRVYIPLLETLGILQVARSGSQIATVTAVVLSEEDVMAQTSRVWDSAVPEPVEKGALVLLRATANLPLTHDEACKECDTAGLDEATARRSIEIGLAHDLLKKRHVSDFRTDFYYNDFLWGQDIERTSAALAALPVGMRKNLRDLMVELHEHEGRPLTEIESASPDMVSLAVTTGIIDATEVRTSDGRSAMFHFTPRFQGFGVSRADQVDSLDQVKLVIASFAFSTRFARYKLKDPEMFLDRLISKGTAGNATPIGTDYGAMERQKIVDVEPTGDGSKHRFRAVKRDTLIDARDSMAAGGLLIPNPKGVSSSFLREPHSVSDPVSTRRRLGQRPGSTPLYDADLLAALREASQKDYFR